MLFIVAAAMFAVIAAAVFAGHRVTSLDVAVSDGLRARASPAATRTMLVVTHLHSNAAVVAYGVVIAIFLAVRRRWRMLIALVTCVAGGLVLNVGMKLAFHRARPVFDEPLLVLSTYSFPSGHVAGTTVFYGFLVFWIHTGTSRKAWRMLALLWLIVSVALVALSRVYLGVHFLSDVVAGFAEGVAWLALCLTVLAGCWPHPSIDGPSKHRVPSR